MRQATHWEHSMCKLYAEDTPILTIDSIVICQTHPGYLHTFVHRMHPGCPDVPYFIILLCLMPDDINRQGESAPTQRVRQLNLWIWLSENKNKLKGFIFHYRSKRVLWATSYPGYFLLYLVLSEWTTFHCCNFSIRMRHLLHGSWRDTNWKINFLSKDCCGHINGWNISQHTRTQPQSVEKYTHGLLEINV